MGGAWSTNGEKRKVYRLLMGKSGGKRSSHVGVWKILSGILPTYLSRIGQAQDGGKWRGLVNAVRTFRFHKMLGKLSSSYTTGGLSSNAHLYRVGQ
jgi:hypothetical protein